MIYDQVKDFTMTTPAAVQALVEAVRRVVVRGVPGALVECGVWKGGSAMAMALACLEMGEHRDLWLYDTFAGMTPPDERDGARAISKFKNTPGWCAAPFEEVKAHLASAGNPGNIYYVVGRVEDTLPANAPDSIAVLRLDSDWYASTRAELEHLWPRLSPGGALIVDDYHCWPGCKKAVDEFFAGRADAPALTPIDHQAVIGWKAKSDGHD